MGAGSGIPAGIQAALVCCGVADIFRQILYRSTKNTGRLHALVDLFDVHGTSKVRENCERTVNSKSEVAEEKEETTSMTSLHTLGRPRVQC